MGSHREGNKVTPAIIQARHDGGSLGGDEMCYSVF